MHYKIQQHIKTFIKEDIGKAHKICYHYSLKYTEHHYLLGKCKLKSKLVTISHIRRSKIEKTDHIKFCKDLN